MKNDRSTRRGVLMGAIGVTAVVATGCRPGLGAQLVPQDYAHTFTRRDLKSVHSLSTASFQTAVWNRLSPQEFREIAPLMGHGRHMDVVDTKFDGDRALIQLRTENKEQYRLHLMGIGKDWRVEDVVKELEPGVYVSKRRQAEAVLAIRDFRLSLAEKDGRGMADACSTEFSREVWSRLSPQQWQKLDEKLDKIASDIAGQVGDVQVSADGSYSAPIRRRPNGSAAPMSPGSGEYVVYFTTERSRLVVDDVHLPKGPPTMRVRLRNELSR